MHGVYWQVKYQQYSNDNHNSKEKDQIAFHFENTPLGLKNMMMMKAVKANTYERSVEI
jgi:hypothetical protein